VFNSQEKLVRSLEFAKEVKTIGFFAIDKARKHIVFPDIQGHKIVIADLNGRIIAKIGNRGDRDGDFNFPSAVALDPQGNIVVCDQMNARIQILTPEGKFKSKFGKRGDGVGEFNIMKGVAVDSEGHIYVTDGRSHRFSIFNDAGDVLLGVGAPKTERGGMTVSAGGFNFPNGIYIDQNDTIYVADVFNLRVQLFQYLNEKYLRENPLPPPPPGKEPPPPGKEPPLPGKEPTKP
jgi:sugar lactone lactonase YvrE